MIEKKIQNQFTLSHLGNKTLCDLCNTKAYRKKISKLAEDEGHEEVEGIYVLLT